MLPRLLQILSLAAVLSTVVWGKPEGGYDTSGDYISNIVAKGEDGCLFVPPPSTAALPQCTAPSRTITKEDVSKVAWKLAPKFYFHPQEWYHLTDPKAWLENAPIFNTTGENTTLAELSKNQAEGSLSRYLTFTGPQNMGSELLDRSMPTFSTEYLNEKMVGADIVDNEVQAKVWFTVADPYETNETIQNTFVITFHYFYEFNGCSNQIFAMNVDGKYQGNELFMCAPGVHEGDWERISVLVCQSDMEALIDNTDAELNSSQYIARMQYAAHSWSNTYDCTVGECPTETGADGITRPIAYSGLFSHASYPWEKAFITYQNIKVGLLMNIDGVYIGDRTSRTGPVFSPSESNHAYIPAIDEMTDDQKYGEFAWAVYPGSWGGFYVTAEPWTITCFDDNFTTMRACEPQNPATYFMMWGLEKVTDVSPDTVMAMQWECDLPLDEPTKPVGRQDLTGPLFRDYSYYWMDDKPAPLWQRGLDATYTCPFSGDPARTASNRDNYEDPNYDVISFLSGVAGLLLGCGVIYGLCLYIWVLYQPKDVLMATTNTMSTDDEESQGRDWKGTYMMTRHFIWMIFSLIVYIIGIVLVAIGIADVFAALNEVVNASLWDQLKKGFNAIVILFGVCQAIFIIFTVFIRSQDILLFNGRSVKNPVAWKGASKAGAIVQAFSCGLTVIMINTTMLLCCFGFFMWVIRFMFQYACNAMISRLLNLAGGAVGDFCLDLNNIGIDKIFCGSALAHVCTLWTGLRIDYLVYGSFIFILSHVMFLSMGSFQCQSLYLQHQIYVVKGKKYEAEKSSSMGSVEKGEKGEEGPTTVVV